MNKFKLVIIPFLIWRTLLFIPLILGFYLIPYRVGQEFTNILYTVDIESSVKSVLLIPWANFDGVHYLSIAVQGYISEARFFPLFPLLIRTLSLGGSWDQAFISAIILAPVLFLSALVVMYILVSLKFGERIARKSVIYCLVFPTSFFFGSVYSESLFLALLLLTFYFAQKKNWLAASIAGALLSATRLVGIFILPVLLIEFFTDEKIAAYCKQRNFTKVLSLGFWIGLVPVGLVSFSVYNFFKWNDALFFLKAQGDLDNGRSVNSIVFPGQTVYRYFKILTQVSSMHFEWWVALLELVMFLGVCGLLLFAWHRGVKKTYLLFSWMAFLLPVLSGTFSGLPRYVTVLFPIYIALALIKNTKLEIFLVCLFVLLQTVLLMFFSRGYYVA